MSSTNRGGQRSPADYYPTPAWCVHRLLENEHFRAASGLDVPGPKRWLEPCVGDGAIVQATRAVEPGIAWDVGDIRPDATCAGAFLRVGDFLSAKPGWGWGEDIDLVISNPPFSLAEPIIRHADLFSDSVVMLLRLAFLSGGKRAPFMRERTPDVYVLPDRPSFDGVGVDSTDYGWFHWHGSPGRRGHVVILENTPKVIRRPKWIAVDPVPASLLTVEPEPSVVLLTLDARIDEPRRRHVELAESVGELCAREPSDEAAR